LTFDDPAYVAAQYATEDGLAARKSIYVDTAGTDPREVVYAAVAEARPAQVLDVGCGPGDHAERLDGDLGVAVVAVDTSERMVELARARGVDARLGDAQELRFDDASFDVVLAASMLYHVPDLERALREIRRVLRPGGRLVAATNYEDHLREMFELVGIERWGMPFSGDNGEELLRRVFSNVESRETAGTVTLRDASAVRRYLSSTARLRRYVNLVPELDTPLVVRRHSVVFVAE